MAFTAMQELFIQHYVEGKTATQAAIEAGYSKHTAAKIASENLLKPEIKAEVEKRLAQLRTNSEIRAAHKGVTLERWVDEVQALGFSDITDAFQPDASGKLTMSLADIKARGLGRMIRKMKVLPSGKIEFELHPKLPALELLAKHYGWIKDLMEHSGSVGTPSVPAEDIQRIHQDPKLRANARAIALALIGSKPNAGSKDTGKEGK